MKEEVKKIIVEYTPLKKWYLQIKKKRDDKQLYKLRAPYLKDIENLIDKDTSIISSNCFAGRIMQDLGMQYNSPTLGLYFWSSDYIVFLSNIRFYLTEAKIEFVEHSKYPIGDERRNKWRHWYPVGLLDGKVEIHFLHYYSEEEAADKWYRRASRVNWEKLLIIGMEQNLCTNDEIKAFEQLTFKNKIFFSTKEFPQFKSNCFIKEFKDYGEVGDPYRKADIFYRELVKHLKQ
jgi:Exopolysaccharide biosynthesis protein